MLGQNVHTASLPRGTVLDGIPATTSGTRALRDHRLLDARYIHAAGATAAYPPVPSLCDGAPHTAAKMEGAGWRAGDAIADRRLDGVVVLGDVQLLWWVQQLGRMGVRAVDSDWLGPRRGRSHRNVAAGWWGATG